MGARSARHLCMDNVWAEPLWPGSGVPAGCFSATYALRCYLRRVMVAQQERYARIMITIHVDDIAQEVHHPTAEGRR